MGTYKIKLLDVSTDDSKIEDELSYRINRKDLVQAAGDPSDPKKQLAAVYDVRKLLSSDKNPPIDDYIEAGILPILVHCLSKHDHKILQYEAAWALTNIAYARSDHTEQVVLAGAVVPSFLELVSLSDKLVCEVALCGLGNIIADGPKQRDLSIEQGVVQLLLSFIDPDLPVSLLCGVAWVIVNLCRSHEPQLPANIISKLWPALNMLIQQTDADILEDSASAIQHLADDGNDQIQMIIDSGVVPKLIPLLGHAEVKVQMAALRAVSNIATGSCEQMQVVLNYDALSYFPALLSHSKEKEEVVWCLSNILDGNQEQVQAVINVGLLPMIIEYLSDGDLETQRTAAWAIDNLTVSGNRDQVFTLINEDVIPPLCDLLDCQDVKLIEFVLDSFLNMLKMADDYADYVAILIEMCDGLEKIEELQNHENVYIYKMAYEIIDKYFNDEICICITAYI